MSQSHSDPPAIVVAIAAMLSLAVAMGIGRFAFTPMLPVMLGDGSLDAAAGPWLAGGNYLGYLVGALTASRLRGHPATTAVASLAAIVLLTAGMGWTTQFWVWLALRTAAGVASAWTLIGTSVWALALLARSDRPQLAAVVFAGVGFGIVLAGVFCLWAAGPGARADELWLGLAVLALVAAVLPLATMRGGAVPMPAASSSRSDMPAEMPLLVLSYGLFGFGYILPATFLPALARHAIDDPRLFGLVWPVFGLAATASTLMAGSGWVQRHRLHVWMTCHLTIALGAVLPTISPALPSLATSAVLIGSCFMVVMMIAMQEARMRAACAATVVLARMTAAFALGQLAGPLLVAVMPAGSFDVALRLAALGLVGSAAVLWHLASRRRQPA